jgi:outer membrane protein assembly factor BamE (lipoprotein component of BamABCDE complex)
MYRLFCLIAIVFLSSACATVGNEQISEPEITNQIQIGKSTKADVKALVGEPTKVNFQENGNEIWEYVFKKGQVKPATFIPLVRIFAGGANVEGNTLTIMFNKDGVVEKYGTGKISGESRI